MISFEVTKSVLNISDENNSFSISTPSHWSCEDGEEPINMLNNLLEYTSEIDIAKQVKEVEKRGTRIKTENNGYNLAGFDHVKCEKLAGLKRVKYKDSQDMVSRTQLTFNEIVEVLDVKYIAGSTKGYTFPPSIYEVSDIKLMLESSVPKEVKVSITSDDIRLKSNLTTKKKTIRFTNRSFFLQNPRFNCMPFRTIR